MRRLLPAAAWLLALMPLPSAGGAEIGRYWELVQAYPTMRSYGYGLDLDPSGSIFIGGSNTYDLTSLDTYRAIAQNVSRIYRFPIWTRSANGITATTYEEAFRTVKGDPSTGGVLAGGSLFDGNLGYAQGLICRFDGAGDLVWSRTLPARVVEGIVLGGTVFIYAVGTRHRTGAVVDHDNIWIGQLNMSGTLLAQADYPDPFEVADEGLDLELAPSGYLYVGGMRTVVGHGEDGIVARFDTNTWAWDLTWTITMNGDVNQEDWIAGVALAPGGDLFVAGMMTSSTVYGADALVVRIADTGSSAVVLWTLTLDGGDHDDDEARDLALDSSGNCWVTGALDPAASTWKDLWLAKVSPAGAVTDQYLRDYTANDDDVGNAVALDSSGNIFVVGTVNDWSGQESLYLGCYTERTLSVEPPVSYVYAYPNPFRPGSGGGFDAASMVFRNLAAGSELRLYTITGILVRDLKDDDQDGRVSWDGKNGKGKEAASGVYLYAVKAPNGALTRGKVVVIR